jgi:hypothetical protein
MVNALEPRFIGAGFDPLACPSLMVPSGGETDVKLGVLGQKERLRKREVKGNANRWYII